MEFSKICKHTVVYRKYMPNFHHMGDYTLAEVFECADCKPTYEEFTYEQLSDEDRSCADEKQKLHAYVCSDSCPK